MLIDIGANLCNKRFQNDLEQVLSRATAAGVANIIVTGTSPVISHAALQLVKNYPRQLFSTAGMHPHHANEWQTSMLEELKSLLAHPKVVAVGECGLDYNRNYSTPEAQLRCYTDQLELATEVNKPVFLHQRDAHAKFVEILRKYRSNLKATVVHCFTGTQAELQDYLELDCHIGITGWICDERRGAHMHGFIDQIPNDRLMVETDAPYLLPRTLTPKPNNNRNEPMYLTRIIEELAHLRGQTVSELQQLTSTNSRAFFGLREVED